MKKGANGMNECLAQNHTAWNETMKAGMRDVALAHMDAFTVSPSSFLPLFRSFVASVRSTLLRSVRRSFVVRPSFLLSCRLHRLSPSFQSHPNDPSLISITKSQRQTDRSTERTRSRIYSVHPSIHSSDRALTNKRTID